MKQQDVFKKLGGIITEINEQYQYLQSVNGVSNDLELELLMANAHFLSDHIEILRKLNAQAAKAQESAPAPVVEALKPAPIPVVETPKPTPPPAPEPEPVRAPEPQYFQPIMAEPEVEEEETAPVDATPAEDASPVFEFDVDNKIETTEEEPAAEEELTPEPILPEPATIRHELTLEDIGEDWDEDEHDNEELAAELAPEEVEAVKIVPAAPIPTPVKAAPVPEPVKEEPVAEKPEEKPQPAPEPPAKHTQIMVAEEEIITINQKMSAQMGTQRMSDQLIGSPIGDLKSAITLNDKLLYIRELFNGYSLAYSEALDMMNRMQNFDEAQAFLKSSYATKNNWADKQAVADKFYALLQRRYL